MRAEKKLLYDCLYKQDEIIATAIARKGDIKEKIRNFDQMFIPEKNFIKKEIKKKGSKA